jgi:hypothetical protein
MVRMRDACQVNNLNIKTFSFDWSHYLACLLCLRHSSGTMKFYKDADAFIINILRHDRSLCKDRDLFDVRLPALFQVR